VCVQEDQRGAALSALNQMAVCLFVLFFCRISSIDMCRISSIDIKCSAPPQMTHCATHRSISLTLHVNIYISNYQLEIIISAELISQERYALQQSFPKAGSWPTSGSRKILNGSPSVYMNY